MNPTPMEALHIAASSQTKQAFEQEATRLHLSHAAYLCYLLERARPGVDVQRLDQITNEVFGKFGPAMRKLAE